MKGKKNDNTTHSRKLRIGKKLTLFGGFCWLFVAIKASIFGFDMKEYWIIAIFIVGTLIGIVGFFMERRYRQP
jgi:hypothetical protein